MQQRLPRRRNYCYRLMDNNICPLPAQHALRVLKQSISYGILYIRKDK